MCCQKDTKLLIEGAKEKGVYAYSARAIFPPPPVILKILPADCAVYGHKWCSRAPRATYTSMNAVLSRHVPMTDNGAAHTCSARLRRAIRNWCRTMQEYAVYHDAVQL